MTFHCLSWVFRINIRLMSLQTKLQHLNLKWDIWKCGGGDLRQDHEGEKNETEGRV